MKLGIDVDGVLARFESGFVRLLHGYTFDLKDPGFPSVWDWPEAAGVPAVLVHEAWEKVKQSDLFWYDLVPTPNGRTDIDALIQARIAGHDIYFITNRMGKQAKMQTEGWLKLYGYNDPTVLISADKSGCTRALLLDAYIDDKPGNLEGHGLGTQLFLQLAPYNRHLDIPAQRVTCVRQMLIQLGIK